MVTPFTHFSYCESKETPCHNAGIAQLIVEPFYVQPKIKAQSEKKRLKLLYKPTEAEERSGAYINWVIERNKQIAEEMLRNRFVNNSKDK